jgi:ankyrin repeat protein
MALYAASKHGHVSVVRKLIEFGADINAKATDDNVITNDARGWKSCRGYTALDAARDNGHAEVVQLLLQHGDGANIPRVRHSFIHISKDGDKSLVFELSPIPSLNLNANRAIKLINGYEGAGLYCSAVNDRKRSFNRYYQIIG